MRPFPFRITNDPSNRYAGARAARPDGFVVEVEVTSNQQALPQVATPVISPSSETSPSSVEVSITCSTPGSTIYYTTDGSTPTTGSAVYGLSTIVVSSTSTVKAMAAAPGYANSNVASETYVISSGGTLTGPFVGYGWTSATHTIDSGGGVNSTSYQEGDPVDGGSHPAGAYSSDLVPTSSPFEIDIEIDASTAPSYQNIAVLFVPANTSDNVDDLLWNPPSNTFALGFYVDGSDTLFIQLVNSGSPNEIHASLLAGNVIIRFHADGTDSNNNLVVSMSNDNFATSTDLGTYSVVDLMGENVIVKLIYFNYQVAGAHMKVSYRAS